MSRTRYCSTCGMLLPENAAMCGECGARYQASPYERRATDAPGAWSQAPKPRSRDLDPAAHAPAQEEGIELISRQSLEPQAPGATTLRAQGQYDQMMVSQPPMNQTGPGFPPGMPSGPGSPAPPQGGAPGSSTSASGPPAAGAPYGTPPPTAPMEAPLDGCRPAPLLKRFLAALADGVTGTLVLVPLMIGVILVLTSETVGLLPQILIGVGTALPAAYTVLMIWLVGAKGFTLGKLFLGLRVARASQGGPIGFLRSLGRWVLYGAVSLIMALSIFLDPKKQLRGFHDRIIDSVVVDAKDGRNPLLPRADDFERESAEHYLGASSVAVSTHENLLSEPGAAWKDGGSAAAQPAPAGGWDDGHQVAPSPYAPSAASGSAAPAPDGGGGAWGQPAGSASSASQPSADGGWGSPPAPPAPSQQGWDQQPAPQSGWDQQPAPQSGWDQKPAPQQSWDSPPVAQDPQQAWGQQPAVQDPGPSQGWGPPVPQPAPQQPWGQQAAEQDRGGPEVQHAPAPSWDQAAAQQQPGPQSDPEQFAPRSDDDGQQPQAPSWGPPSAQEPTPQQSAPQESWDQPQQTWDRPQGAEDSVPSAETQGWAPPAGQDDGFVAAAPSDLTGDAWGAGDDSVDEQTRLTVADDSLGDLEQTRISAVQLPAVKKLRLVTDDGAERLVEKAVVIGRNPSAPANEVLFVMKDDTRSVSKTHLLVDGTGDEVTVTDLGSTNGSAIVREDGTRENLVPNTPTALPHGASVALGDRTLSVEREQ